MYLYIQTRAFTHIRNEPKHYVCKYTSLHIHTHTLVHIDVNSPRPLRALRFLRRARSSHRPPWLVRPGREPPVYAPAFVCIKCHEYTRNAWIHPFYLLMFCLTHLHVHIRWEKYTAMISSFWRDHDVACFAPLEGYILRSKKATHHGHHSTRSFAKHIVDLLFVWQHFAFAPLNIRPKKRWVSELLKNLDTSRKKCRKTKANRYIH